MPKVIAIFNQSGGVSKTTLTMNLGYHLAQSKKQRVLLIDMDPQSSLTTFMGVGNDEEEELEATIYDAIVKEEPLPVIKNIHGMDLVPANIVLCSAEVELASAMVREQRLNLALKPVLDDYDFVLIDCPPSLGLLSIMTLFTATHLLVPIQCQFKAFKGTELLLQTVGTVREKARPDLVIAGFVPTMFDKRTAQESRTLKAIQDQLKPVATVFPPVPKSIAFADASEAMMPLAAINARHPAVATLKKIAKALEKI
jgi:chromosome partitioning protein